MGYIYYKFSRDSKCERNYIETRNDIDILLNILEQNNVTYPCELLKR